MTDGQVFLLVLALIYLSDCLLWIPPGGVALVAAFARRFAAIRPSQLFGNDKGGLVFGFPLPPFGAVFLTQAPTYSLGADHGAGIALAAENPGRPGPAPMSVVFVVGCGCLSFVGSDPPFVGGERIAECVSPTAARRTARLIAAPGAKAALRRGGRSPPPPIGASFDERRASESRTWCCARARCSGRIASRFLRCFCGLSLAAIGFTVPRSNLFILLLMFGLLMIGTALEFFSVHRRLSPASRGPLAAILSVLLVPQHANPRVRRDHLAGRLPAFTRSPWRALMPEEKFRRFAGRLYRDARFLDAASPGDRRSGGGGGARVSRGVSAPGDGGAPGAHGRGSREFA
ncbi:MAG: hypothetical protein R3F11_18075 [Verrucomicrobiales bacterium]